MKCFLIRTFRTLIALSFLAVAQSQLLASAITPGDLVIYRVGTGTGSLINTGNQVFIDEYTTGGTLVQSIAMPTTASGGQNQLIASGTATSEGLLTVSPNGQYVAATGYAANLGGSSLAGTSGTSVPRSIGIIPVATGTPDTSTALTDYANQNNPRSVVTTNGSSIWASGAGANALIGTVFGNTGTNDTTLVTTPANFRQINIFGGQLFVSTSSGTTFRLATVGSGTPTASGQTLTNLPGFATSTGSPYAFYFADLDATANFSGTGLDTLYVADDGAGSPAGQIQKYTFSSGTGNWTASGTAAAAAVRGLTGTVSGTTVSLFGTTGGSTATGGGTLYGFTDTTGYGGSISGSASTLATAATNEAFRGVAVVVPEPSSVILAGLSVLGLAASSRRLRKQG